MTSSRTKLKDPILITGAGGFIGSHLTELCVSQGYRVRAFVHYRSANDWGWLDDSPVKNDIEVCCGDISDFDMVYRSMEGCGTVLHLAALIGIPYSYLSPQAYIRTNISGTCNIMEAARLHQTPRIVVTSTSETYGTAQYVPIDEKHPAVGQSPYAATKIGADQFALSYHRSFDLPVWVVRPFNTYGPRQSARAIIPTVISQIISGRRQLKLGNVEPTRDLTFVKDTAAGFLSVAECDELVGGATNIGMNHEISIRDLVLKIGKLMDVDVEIQTDSQRVRPVHSEVERLFCDNSRLRQHTSWCPKYDLDRGLMETIEFLRSHMHLYKPDAYNI